MAKILFFDLESAPNVGYTWGKWEQNVIEFLSESHLLCYAYAWNDGKVKVRTLPEYGNEKALVTSLWELLNEADIVIAHNGNQFDIKYINGRFLEHEIQPPDKYQVVDTLLVARSKFKFNSNKLNDLGTKLKLGQKVTTGGFALWKGCMEDDQKSWKLMAKYNKQDVVLLRQVYYRLRPWMNRHPNINTINMDTLIPKCSICGSTKVWRKGFEPLGNGLRQRWKCECGANQYAGLKGNLPIRPA